jgi:hypothetical protein
VFISQEGDRLAVIQEFHLADRWRAGATRLPGKEPARLRLTSAGPRLQCGKCGSQFRTAGMNHHSWNDRFGVLPNGRPDKCGEVAFRRINRFTATWFAATLGFMLARHLIHVTVKKPSLGASWVCVC